MAIHTNQLWNDPAVRLKEFPVLDHHLFMAHAGVCTLPRVAKEALVRFAEYGATTGQEDESIWALVHEARGRAAQLIGAQPDEMALLGPTALGLSLVANGFPWQEGDEVVYYADDYPANVYPWLALRKRGVTPVPIVTDCLGKVTWEAIERVLTPRTRMVALASCHYLTGYRIAIQRIGRSLRERGIYFSLDGIQTLGAWPTTVEYVDFLSADSHKWMLGPVGAGIFYVRKELQEMLAPTLLGAWNVESPEFIAQNDIRYYPGARRYEPGSLNIPGILAMSASMDLLLQVGTDTVSGRVGELADLCSNALEERGFITPDVMKDAGPENRSGIVTVRHKSADLNALHRHLKENHVVVSVREDRAGRPHLRVSPHFYNSEDDCARFLAVVDDVL